MGRRSLKGHVVFMRKQEMDRIPERKVKEKRERGGVLPIDDDVETEGEDI
ncbi:uncharacterized protein G2W53_019199 [Senna tora]|uniref:Uncharacterized protein n=1 Tax=Senna tora TaxID=362788 RepID=A0A834WLS6_9FABA|nr:uncharacterized protein G2W53_019199 [Senna tora]